jgi:hypothetical protein
MLLVRTVVLGVVSPAMDVEVQALPPVLPEASVKHQHGFALSADLLLAGGAVLALVLLIVGINIYLDGRDKQNQVIGEERERGKWQKREAKQVADYQAEIERVRLQRDGEAARFNAAIAAAAAKHRKEVANAKRKSDRFVADVRAGRVVLRDPGRSATAECPAGGGGETAGASAPGGGNGAAAAGLSLEAQEFLWSEAGRADGVVEQLGLAQSVITAYYELCKH